MPLINTIILLADNCKGYVPLLALKLMAQGTGIPAMPVKEALFTKSIVNAYIIAILKLWQV
jgi:hypothetical protein